MLQKAKLKVSSLFCPWVLLLIPLSTSFIYSKLQLCIFLLLIHSLVLGKGKMEGGCLLEFVPGLGLMEVAVAVAERDAGIL